jgi:membrane-bound ClpP family serine protease
LAVVKDVLPILAIIFFFQYGILKNQIENLRLVIIGFILVILGLYAFILGLEMGLFALGESMAFQLTQAGNMWVIYTFAFAIGFSTTMAEPALMAIAKKIKRDKRRQDKRYESKAVRCIRRCFWYSFGCIQDS